MTQELQTQKVLSIVNAHLGEGAPHRKGEMSYFCPACNHYKRKLQINTQTQRWHCWVCNIKGTGVYSLLKKTGGSRELLVAAKELDPIQSQGKETVQQSKQLPDEFRPLHINWNTPHYKNALHYVVNVRGLTPLDILRYNIGYCEEGEYSGMIIVPSYDKTNRLNYFMGRSYYNTSFKHKNPIWSKDVVGFENQISYNQPLTLVEGVFDAISTKRNVVPLFGKRIMPTLRHNIVANKVPKLYISLDQDAVSDALTELEYFMNSGIDVCLVNLTKKDPNELGYKAMTELVKQSQPFTFMDLIKYRMSA